MPKPATGSAFHSRGAWYARVTLDAGKRKAFRLTETTEAAANARLVVLADVAAKLRKAGHGDRAEAFVREAATASPEDLAAVVQLADALCRGEMVPIVPSPGGPNHWVGAVAGLAPIRPWPRTGGVYFVLGADDKVKIGLAKNVALRLRNLHNGCPRRLRLLAVTDGGYELEHEFHIRFADYRVCGEWFEPTLELVTLISSLRGAA